ncbi:MAG TPA: prepilin-type N-terminal cleavage/methylation domain-containing protein [Chthoniobacterales bacterium]|jgi:prepilin-type N-terminal cleavage/methylation domain-containing protein|nr:prepilin-type N-terminal cleavage/methylation domain-containing protein [Chthoniobacterales bacterium]
MFIVPVNRRRGFTLLEIIMAVAILATMALAIYRFVQSNLIAIRLSSEANAADARYDGLREVLAAQWQSLPSGKGALLGDAFKLNDRERDEIRWICSAGPGLMTRYAAGDFVVALRLQSEKKDSDRLDLGFLRKPKDDSALTNANESWIPLIENVRSLQVRYFDARLNVWVERWNDTQALPRLVKVIVGRPDAVAPWEAIIPLGRRPM